MSGSRLAQNAALIVALALAAPGHAEDRKLTAAEIEGTLAGNTVDGSWRGTPYRQFFAGSGTTTYVAKDSPPSVGRWKTDPAKDRYCSWWQGSGWDCYDIHSDAPGRIIWVVPDNGYRSPATVLEGNRL